MPLFGSSHHTQEPARVDRVDRVDETPAARKGSIFSRNRHTSPDRMATNTTNSRANRRSVDNGSPRNTTGGGFFSRRRNSSSDMSDHSSRRGAHSTTAASTGGRTGFFNSRMKDATLDAARGKVHAAELAEREADKALVAARGAVVEAKRHVEILEKEANEQARLAQEKILAARSIKNDAGHLGRHNN